MTTDEQEEKSTNNVVFLETPFNLDPMTHSITQSAQITSVEKVLNAALGIDLAAVVLVGVTEKGELYVASDRLKNADTLFILEWGKQELADIFFGKEE